MAEAFQWRTSLREADIAAVGALVTATGAFNEEEIAIAAELAADRVEKDTESDYRFLLAESGGRLAGYSCYGRIPFTQGRYDLYWIAVHPDYQRRRLARSLLERTETLTLAEGGVILYAETSSRPPYEAARRFYRASGFTLAAQLPKFYSDADDKLIYAKRLQPGA